MLRALLMVVSLLVTMDAYAQVPVTGRMQQMTFPRAPVQVVAAQAYGHQLAQLRAQGMLDTDAAVLARVRGICGRLIAQAIRLKPEAAAWHWEVHITSNPHIAAFSMGGGKLLVGTHFIERFGLSDDELAVGLAHEIGHVIAEHVREQVSIAAGFRRAPPNYTLTVADIVDDMNSDISVMLRLQPLSRIQEMEADDIGIELAARAGVPPTAVIGFYAKLVRTGERQSLFDTHGSPRQRFTFVKSMAEYAHPVYEASRGVPSPTYTYATYTYVSADRAGGVPATR